MFKNFLRHYFELPPKNENLACLGGGVGTAQILKGLRDYPYNLTAVVSMADDGGSAGRLRRAFAVPPPGDLINCITALSDEESTLNNLFLYRFAGKRYGKDTDLGGQKLGNLIFVALTDMYKGNTSKALDELSRIVSSRGRVLPATSQDVNIWAVTKDNKKVFGEQNIDLGNYSGSRTLKEVHLEPKGVKAYKQTIEAIENADTIVVGPGDLFSTIIPVLIVNQIKEALLKSKAKKIFIVNIANKPFETVGFKASDYIKTVKKHIGADIFDKILINTAQGAKIPKNLNYKYVAYDKQNLKSYSHAIIEANLINTKFPLYHDSNKVAKLISTI